MNVHQFLKKMEDEVSSDDWEYKMFIKHLRETVQAEMTEDEFHKYIIELFIIAVVAYIFETLRRKIGRVGVLRDVESSIF